MTSLPLVEDQLVLELEGWEPGAEVVELLLGGRSGWFSAPVDKDVPHST
jgi:hypothetical protein